MTTAMRQEHRQTQTLTPRLQQAVRLLQLSSLDFAQEVQQAMGSNPFLEADESEVESSAPDGSDAQPSTLEALDHTGQDGAGDAPWETAQWSGTSSPASGKGSGSGDGDVEMADVTAADETLRQRLRTELSVLPLSARDRVIVATLIEALDEDGYLRVPLAEVANLTGLAPEPDDSEMLTALKLVQSIEPGVGARDLRECLLMQLDARDAPCGDARELARRIVADHLQQLAVRDINGLARALGATPAEIEKAGACIRHLDPRPGWRYGSSDIRFVTPDVIVRKVRGQWTAVLNPAVIPRVRLNRMYAELFQSHRDARHGDLGAQLQEARWTVRNVEQRFTTILRVAEAIVARQKHFLEYGELAMKPMGLREIADKLGLHESTVSRVTNNKYMATRLGVFELKYFFSRALPTASGGACSATAIRGVIKDMITGEDPFEPLSDAQIARLLARQGLQVARRTVTKYRQMMKVPAVEMRRQRR